MDLTKLQNVKALMASHGLTAKKFLGQNFLIDSEALDAIVESAQIQSSDEILEIGPGLGVLTNKLLEKAKKVSSIELDPQMIEVLKNIYKDAPNFEIIHADALRIPPPLTPYKVVANIPYNITSPLLNHFLQAPNKPISLTLLIQKEVAAKICAIEPDMTVLSLQVNLFGKPTYIKTVLSSSFHPSPKVDSAIIHIQTYTPKDPNYLEDAEAIKILKRAKGAFHQRRKKIINTLNLRTKLEELEKIGIDPNCRPQTLSIAEWQKLLPILN